MWFDLILGLVLTIAGAASRNSIVLRIGLILLIFGGVRFVIFLVRYSWLRHKFKKEYLKYVKLVQQENVLLFRTAAAVLKHVAKSQGSGTQEWRRACEHLIRLSDGELTLADADELLQSATRQDINVSLLNQEQRFVLLRLAIDIAAVDEKISSSEKARLEGLAKLLEIPLSILHTLLEMLFGDPVAETEAARDKAYKTLKVAPGASIGELRAARNRLMLDHHPDKASKKNREAAHLKATEINAAYDLLIGRK